ncbi:Cell cycle control protein cwf19 [Pyrenophora tritici-repentis]|nr:Cell cycle control protein cwf19 [Pyrenophora tritici-repentis]KAI0586679.1 Cell cycle control protein cwf19 [Pyrenophora tritici-repentis]KAI0606448.1 Cell cycle control protein cwf19 [Pyrenophora tritici-repentis]KAI1586752.1 cell cycle control protein cwf19 [Pyrenophora tritici-repentis]PWO29796.1 antibiotic biosynthesis monooxygenase [Pyrenophora tritici-repentis]
MGLEDFEKELAQSKKKEDKKKRDRSRSRDRHSRKHRSSRHHDDDERDERHRHKRSRHHRETSEERARRKRKEREDKDDQKDYAPPDDDILDQQLEEAADADLQRDDWMKAPSSMDIDYVQRKKREEKTTYVRESTQPQSALKIHKAELNHHLADSKNEQETVADEPTQREVNYTFGDTGAQWRMTKLRGIYRNAEESGKSVEEIAMEKYGDLRDFDEAREEEIELDRRKMYGKDYVGKEKPSGELYEERRLAADIHRPSRTSHEPDELPQGEVVSDPQPVTNTGMLSQTELNRLKAQMMKAKMKKAPNAAQLEAEYNAALANSSSSKDRDVVILNAMDNRMLAGGRQGEVTALTNKRGTERGLVKENDDMSIDDMVRQERRTKGQAGGEGALLASKIAKDAKFDNSLDYIDDNASKLAARAPKSSINLRNAAIQDYTKMNRILDSCPLCHHEDKSPPQPPVAPIVSLATRIFLTLPTEPEISTGGAVIVPIQHRTNLVECDDDEWEEIRNFMKSLTRMYHDQGRDVVFYENAAFPGRKGHAAMNVVPIPFELGDTAPAFFKEAILESAGDWTQHKPIIDTAKASRNGLGKQAFRRSLAKEMPYFHVWFELDGGLGHVVEDGRAWPRGDLFAREVLGGQ